MKRDKLVAVVLFAGSVAVVAALMISRDFFDWAYERHQNQWSWFLRPVFIIPFCYFAYRRSWTGLSATIFCIVTSMFWFNTPSEVPEDVKSFLRFEKEWLYGSWDLNKMVLMALAPVSLSLLALAFWKRSLLAGIAVVVLMATGKLTWSIYNAGEAGRAIVVPALTGLIICVALIVMGYRRLQKRSV